MPTATFFNLPQKKRDTLMAAARTEFARVPYPEASINRIIQDAGIPRGSFYMYFEGKEDLFRYLMGTYVEGGTDLMIALLGKHSGDVFEALLGLFDFVQRDYHAPERDAAYTTVLSILRNNAGMQPGTIFCRGEIDKLVERMAHEIDPSLLELHGPHDFSDMMQVLFSVISPAILRGMLGDGGSERVRLINKFDILRRGMAAPVSVKRGGAV